MNFYLPGNKVAENENPVATAPTTCIIPDNEFRRHWQLVWPH